VTFQTENLSKIISYEPSLTLTKPLKFKILNMKNANFSTFIVNSTEKSCLETLLHSLFSKKLSFYLWNVNFKTCSWGHFFI